LLIFKIEKTVSLFILLYHRKDSCQSFFYYFCNRILTDFFLKKRSLFGFFKLSEEKIYILCDNQWKKVQNSQKNI